MTGLPQCTPLDSAPVQQCNLHRPSCSRAGSVWVTAEGCCTPPALTLRLRAVMRTSCPTGSPAAVSGCAPCGDGSPLGPLSQLPMSQGSASMLPSSSIHTMCFCSCWAGCAASGCCCWAGSAEGPATGGRAGPGAACGLPAHLLGEPAPAQQFSQHSRSHKRGKEGSSTQGGISCLSFCTHTATSLASNPVLHLWAARARPAAATRWGASRRAPPWGCSRSAGRHSRHSRSGIEPFAQTRRGASAHYICRGIAPRNLIRLARV